MKVVPSCQNLSVNPNVIIFNEFFPPRPKDENLRKLQREELVREARIAVNRYMYGGAT